MSNVRCIMLKAIGLKSRLYGIVCQMLEVSGLKLFLGIISSLISNMKLFPKPTFNTFDIIHSTSNI